VEGKKRTYVQNTYYSQTLEQAVMTIGTPIKDKEGNLIAVLAGHVNLAGMSEIMLQSSGLSISEDNYIVNKFNFFVTEPRFGEGYALKKTVHTDGVKACIAGNNGVGFYNDHRGIPVIGAYRWMPEQELCILAEVEQAEAYEPIWAMRQAQLWIGAVVAAIVALMGLLFARTITRPVLHLLKGAREVGRGNLEYRIESGAKDEIGQLGGAFNDMTGNLRLSLGALQESEAKYRNLTESLEELIYRADPETFVATYVNSTVEKIFGYTVEEFLGDSSLWESAIHPEDKERVFAWFTEATRKMESGAIEYRIIRKDKTVRWVEDHPGWEKDQQGNAISLNGVLSDITGRKQADEMLRKSEEKYRAVVETSVDGVISVDLQKKISVWNKGAERVFRFTEEEMLGQSLMKIVPERYKKEKEKGFVEFLKSGTGPVIGKTLEIQGLRKDGTEIPVELSISSKRDNETHIATAIVRDISDRKQAEKEKENLQNQLIQVQKMETIGTLAGGIAHDFNNLLFPIMGHTELLLMDTPDDSPFRGDLNQINTASLRARDLVKQILTFARQNSSELILMKMKPIVKEALRLIRSTISTTIEIKQDINPDGCIIKADPTQIHQIVMNLTTNAYHAMEETGGELRVGLKEIEIGEQDMLSKNMEPGIYACLSIADTGIGMNKELIEKIFDPFFTTKESGKGTGMGLSVVHGIVNKMGGSIRVYSEPGKGSEFYVYFPVEKNSSEEHGVQPKEPVPCGNEQILLVDDKEAILTIEKQMLERLGYQVTSRNSSLEALEAFRANPDKFDLIITDMQMPNMPGDKLSAELIKILPDIPILLCTGFSETMSEEKAASLGIKGLLLKPIVMRDLSQKIREVLDKK